MLDGQVLVTKQDLDDFSKKLDLVTTHLDTILLLTKVPEVIKVSDISEMENVSVTQLWGKERYLLPRFGLSAYPLGATRWPLQEYLEWRAISPSKREQMWRDLPPNEKQKIVMGKHAEAS